MPAHVPEKGDFITLSFDPQSVEDVIAVVEACIK
jgi:hypothetical protein